MLSESIQGGMASRSVSEKTRLTEGGHVAPERQHQSLDPCHEVQSVSEELLV